MAAGSSVDEGKTVSGAVKYGTGNWIFSLDGLHRTSEDYDIPVPAESRRQLAADGEAFPGPVDSVVENTGVELYAYGGGVSYVGDRGFLGRAVKHTDSTYGVPGHEHHHEEEGEGEEEEGHEHEAGVFIDLELLARLHATMPRHLD